jgi:hypothetical protein
VNEIEHNQLRSELRLKPVTQLGLRFTVCLEYAVRSSSVAARKGASNDIPVCLNHTPFVACLLVDTLLSPIPT